jgi:hypothetical protein
MGFLDRLFGKKKGGAAQHSEEPRPLPGIETAQTEDEQAATRRSMEAEMDAQRARRTDTT